MGFKNAYMFVLGATLVMLFAATSAHAGKCGHHNCAQTKYGDKHTLRNTIHIRGVGKSAWDTHNLVPLSSLVEATCATPAWSIKQSDWIFIANEIKRGDPVLYFWSSDQNKLIKKQLTVVGKKNGFETWRGTTETTDPTDFDYFVYMLDTASTGDAKMDKRYRFEAFPARHKEPKCDAERPDQTVDIKSGGVGTLQINSGQGGEPSHP